MENWYEKIVVTSGEIIDKHTPTENEAMVMFATTPSTEGGSEIHTSIMGEPLSVCAVIGAVYEYLVSEGKLKPKE